MMKTVNMSNGWVELDDIETGHRVPSDAGTWPVSDNLVEWCVQHRPLQLRKPSIITTAPKTFAPPTNPPRQSFGFFERSAAKEFAKQFYEETLKQAETMESCRSLGICDVVYLAGSFFWNGPYLWAETHSKRFVLIEINLWPQLHSTECCLPRLLDMWGDPLGVIHLTSGLDVQSMSEDALGPNNYTGICPCIAY
jgi:hypothetical protein